MVPISKKYFGSQNNRNYNCENLRHALLGTKITKRKEEIERIKPHSYSRATPLGLAFTADHTSLVRSLLQGLVWFFCTNGPTIRSCLPIVWNELAQSPSLQSLTSY